MQRAKNNAVDSRALLGSLDVLARDRACGFDWELNQYDKQRRCQGPDRAGMVVYVPLLKVILQHCPGGRPAFVQLRDVWLALLEKYDIMDGSLHARI